MLPLYLPHSWFLRYFYCGRCGRCGRCYCYWFHFLATLVVNNRENELYFRQFGNFLFSFYFSYYSSAFPFLQFFCNAFSSCSAVPLFCLPSGSRLQFSHQADDWATQLCLKQFILCTKALNGEWWFQKKKILWKQKV